MVKGFGDDASRKRVEAKERIAAMLEGYKVGIEKVARMLRDRDRTRFVVVCIAEYLSVSETQRLLRELKRNEVRASHVVVNQLVVENALSARELEGLEGLAEVGNLQLNQTILGKTVHACRLMTARKAIQEKYLDMLKSFPEVKDVDGICEVPLLAEEVTGNEALIRFAGYMINNPPAISKAVASTGDEPIKLDADPFLKMKDTDEKKIQLKQENNNTWWSPTKGDTVRITGLEKSGQYNGLEGTVVSEADPETNRYGISLKYQGQVKTLALQTYNMELLHSAKKMRIEKPKSTPSAVVTEENVSKAKLLLDDPEIKALIDSNPKFRNAVEDVLNNPMNFMKYLADPEMAPLISKAMAKLKF